MISKSMKFLADVPDQISQVLNFNYFNSTANQLSIANIQNSVINYMFFKLK